MAVFKGGPAQSFDFDRLDITAWLSGTVLLQTPAEYSVQATASLVVSYSGSDFTYDANKNLVSGTVTAISTELFGQAWVDIADFSLSATALRAFVESGDTQGLLATLFSGDDIIDRAFGGNQTDLLDGFGGNDSIHGADGNDTLRGGAGNDTLRGGTGNDRLTGGKGDDWYYVDSADDIVDEADGSGSDRVLVDGVLFDLADQSRGTIEHIQIVSGAFATVVGNDSANRVTGNDSDSAIIGAGGNDSIDARGGNDDLKGDAGNDTLDGGEDGDTLEGGAGADSLRGGGGNDSYVVDDQDKISETQSGILGGEDAVRYSGAKGSYTLGANLENLGLVSGITGTGNNLANGIIGNADANKLFGMAENDSLDGGDGDDTLDGGAGADRMTGRGGDDTYVIDSNGDFVDEGLTGAGIDLVRSSVSFDLSGATGQAAGIVENLILTGKSTIDGTGNAADNTLTGNGAKNRLLGLGGDDILDGGLGADSLIGGSGSDTYIVDSTTDIVDESGTDPWDTIIAAFSVDLSSDAYKNIEFVTITGTKAANATGNDAENDLRGNTAANRLSGGGAADLLFGDKGNDTLDGGAGDDILIGGLGNDVYLVDSAKDFIFGEDANRAGGMDTVRSSASEFRLAGNIENLILVAGAGNGFGNDLNNLITGNDDGNLLFGGNFNNGPGNDTLNGAGGDDSLDGGTLGKDLMIGGAGSDMYYADDGDRVDESKATGGSDVVFYRGSKGCILGANIENLTLESSLSPAFGTGNSLDNHIDGNGEDNKLRGLAGADSLTAGGGNDTLDGGSSADRLEGGIGNDLYIVNSIADEIRDSAGDGYDTVESSISFNLGDNGATVRGEFEALRLTGTAVINGTGNALNNVISGNGAANILDGGEGVDILEGNNGNDSLIGGEGDKSDHLDGGAGADTMDGGEGDDFYRVNNIRDIVAEHDGIFGGIDSVTSTINYTLAGEVETLFLGGKAVSGTGNSSDNRIDGNQTNTTLRGLDGNDTITDRTGNDTLDGGAGNDTLLGGTGNDTYIVDSFDDLVDETFSDGNDTVIASVTYTLSTAAAANVENLTLAAGAGNIDGRGNDQDNRITGNDGRNMLAGFSGDDTIVGGSHDDQLLGGDGNDSLSGGNDIDHLVGGAGNDTLSGGLGRDFYAYESALDGRDLIVGFDGNSTGDQDFLDMDTLFDSLGVATAARTARVQASDRGAAVDIRVDTDGDGSFDLFAATLQTSDAVTVGVDILVGIL